MSFFGKNLRKDISSDEKDVEMLIKLLVNGLPSFPNSDIFQQDIDVKGNEDEDAYTETLVKYLAYKKEFNNYRFSSFAGQKGKRKVDIGVELKANNEFYIFTIEAKFLPHSPNDYITGEYSAIKRFKKCEHGLSNTNPKKAYPLPENGIVAYVKSKKLQEHKNKINKQLKELANSYQKVKDNFGLNWDISEKLMLEKQNEELFAKLKSTHTRIDNSKLILHHFWINVAQKVV